ncbi:hypothetical protein [Neorhodopirellula lusitana]|nr:hypothetical protein [Neorhodopirellula lusitana]
MFATSRFAERSNGNDAFLANFGRMAVRFKVVMVGLLGLVVHVMRVPLIVVSIKVIGPVHKVASFRVLIIEIQHVALPLAYYSRKSPIWPENT